MIQSGAPSVPAVDSHPPPWAPPPLPPPQLAMAVWTQPLVGSQLSLVQASPSSHEPQAVQLADPADAQVASAQAVHAHEPAAA